ncbi:Acetyl-coenzyme A synthetase, cytoplasmic [Acipenser ruthenus]|uniref:Acetyl-coenzyme A synthetase, cytoplasmic n=1 Tax=Acipenser ruthenus TaxID=7906 RepID=A0A444V2H1_ACIRT|nr:Acetyl-coenzyme A synthetase, cytoplasmic [Acipenser ruthenus]
MIPNCLPQGDVYHASEELIKEAHVPSFQKYKELYFKSVDNPEGAYLKDLCLFHAEFWGDIAKEFYWKSKHRGQFLDYNFDVTKGKIYIKCMEGATTNICYNVLDRNVKERKLGDKIAFLWEGNEPGDEMKITYRELLLQVCRFANVLRSQGVKKGDRVSIYMPMIVELVVAMLACARIGAVHSIVFAGFSAESLCERILDSNCALLITADGFYRGDKLINLKLIADEALQKCKEKNLPVKKCIVVKHLCKEEVSWDGSSCCSQSPPTKRVCHSVQVPWNPDVDLCWHKLMKDASEECDPEWCDSEDPLFVLYTSGSTGKPKGVLHTVGGYLLYTAATFKYVFDYQPDDVYWCTADIGWITGHSYITYGPLANGATSVLFEGLPTYPDVSRLWEIVDKYKVTKFYTAPTAIRLLMKSGNEPVQKYSRKSLKILGTVGEPINPEAWLWYYNIVGDKRCPVVDTFWQTETTFPFFGVVPAILNESGEELEGEAEGYLVFKQPWPGVMRTVYGNHQRFETTYFKKFPGYYVTGDGCRRDKDGYYWITGRIDDMLNVSGHLLSTAEVESALVEHSAVAEAAVVSHPHDVKGECLYCFVTLKDGQEFTKALEAGLRKQVREKIGPIATPDYIQNAPGLPKTRSGKIMRRVLRKIARNDKDLGDISTLADPTVIEQLFNSRCVLSPNTPYLDLSIVFVLYPLCGVFLSSFEKQRCPIVFQTFPFFGVVPAILNESGEELEGEAEGYLVFKQPWPGVMRTVYGNHQRFETTYFKKFPGYYVTGDGCRRDKDGYYWITGRIDDMLNVSGHLLSTAEVESALVEHSAVAEAAVVSHPHDVKGECLYCFVTLKDGQEFTKALEAGLRKQVREKIGPIATPDYIQNAPGLPKTRSGKIMRRVLRKIARNDKDLGDISTLADPTVIEQLFNSRCVL